MKLTKKEATAHAEACRILKKPVLSGDDRLFVLENWHPGANHINSAAGAYFTPTGLAKDLSIEVSDGDVLDLCAGIGTLAYFACWRIDPKRRVICVEINPDYIEVGKKILPNATWIQADVISLPTLDLPRCHYAIGNTPFGISARRSGHAPRYRGAHFEYHVLDIASDLARDGVFLIPQSTSPFLYSGRQGFELKSLHTTHEYQAFQESTQIELTNNCGIDTSPFLSEWRGVSIKTEIVLADFQEAREKRSSGTSLDLF
jgi:hypothetical protein